MNTEKAKPGASFYGLGPLLLVIGCLLAALILYRGARGLPAAIARAYDLDRLTQVVVPGSTELTLPRAGAYAVYYEHRSVVDGIQYAADEVPPALECTLTAQATGSDVALVPDYVPTNRYATYRNRRVGTLMMSTTVNEPGRYTFSCRLADGSQEPQVVLAIGQNLFFELMAAVAHTAGSLLGSLAVATAIAAASLLVAAVITVAVAIRRNRSGEPVAA